MIKIEITEDEKPIECFQIDTLNPVQSILHHNHGSFIVDHGNVGIWHLIIKCISEYIYK